MKIISKTDFDALVSLITFQNSIPVCLTSRQNERISEIIHENSFQIMKYYYYMTGLDIISMTHTEPDVISIVVYDVDTLSKDVIELMMGR